MANVTRRNFLAASAVTAGLAGLAGCDATSGGSAADPLAAPAADSYPIEPDGEGIEAKYTTSSSRKDGWTKAVNPDGGAEVGVMDEAKIIQVDGYAFRDMNGNGKLDLWEDWRQTAEDRAAALAEELSAEEIAPLLFHGGVSSTATPLDEDSIAALEQGARAGVSRATASLDNYVEAIAWINAVQQECEQLSQGIPYMNSTDPYSLYGMPDSHCLASSFDSDLWRRAGHFTGRSWRCCGVRVNLGPQVDVGSNIIYARMSGTVCEDPATNRDLTKHFGGGMQSTWGDSDCTDDQGWGKDSVAIMLKHYVGAGAVEGGRNDHQEAGKYDVFPGDNYNAHLIPFIDGGMQLDSVTGQMASVMTNYGCAWSEDEQYGEVVAGAYSSYNIGFLRNAGWDGMICTDWGVLTDDNRPWGVEDLTVAERMVRMLDAGVDQVGGDFYPDTALEAYELMKDERGEDEALARFRASARRIFNVMVNVQLFDNPYSDREYALEVLEDEEANQFAQDAADKCIVMLKNDGTISSEGISGKPKCYIPMESSAGGGGFSFFGGSDVTPDPELSFDEDVMGQIFEIVTDNVAEDGTVTDLTAEELAGCEYVLFPISAPSTGEGVVSDGGVNMNVSAIPTDEYRPISLQYREYTAETARDPSLAGNTLEDGTQENRSYRGRTVTASNEGDLDRLLEVRKALPDAKIILVVRSSGNAQCFHEIEPSADVILWTWTNSTFDESYGRILAGEVEPTALLPCQMPIDMEAVEASLEDVPRDVDCYVDSAGNAYDFCFGLNWNGVIDDVRTAAYKVNPLTELETETSPGE